MHKSELCLLIGVLQNSQTVGHLYTAHLKRRIELAEIKIEVKKAKLQDMVLDIEIKGKKLDMEMQKLEREVSEFKSQCYHDCKTIY